MIGRVLIIAGSDSGGGAGIQADIKTVTALGGYAATAVTALTAQNTTGVFGVVGVEPAFIREQIEVVLGDIGADAIKTGMLHSAAVIEVVAETLERLGRGIPLVVDPVMVAKGGASLLDPAAIETLVRRLLPLATVLTPNLPEAEALTGLTIEDLDAMVVGGRKLLTMGARAVLVKGGHLSGDRLSDVLVTSDAVEIFESERIVTRHTHGTGCTLASAVATGLARGWGLRNSVARAREYVAEAIRQAPGLGKGHGPLHHGHMIKADDLPWTS